LVDPVVGACSSLAPFVCGNPFCLKRISVSAYHENKKSKLPKLSGFYFYNFFGEVNMDGFDFISSPVDILDDTIVIKN
jgi:hypothetical protein